MLKFYYNPISSNACRVWIALIEKQIPFEPILVKLDGDQLDTEFTTVNPLQRVPVIVDNGLRVIESLAILDYLDAQYPDPALLPKQPDAIAMVRMVEMLVVNELQPAMMILTRHLVGFVVAQPQLDMAKTRITTVMQFFEGLIDRRSYIVGNAFTQADIVGGIAVFSLDQLGIDLNDYPGLKAWSGQLTQRNSWKQTAPSADKIQAAFPNIKKILEHRL